MRQDEFEAKVDELCKSIASRFIILPEEVSEEEITEITAMMKSATVTEVKE